MQTIKIQKAATLADLERELESRIEYYWTTQTGVKIPVKEMSNTHLINTINMLRRLNTYEEEILGVPSDIFFDKD